MLSEASAAPPQADIPAHAPPWLGTLCPTLLAWLGLVPSGVQVRGNSTQVLMLASAGTCISINAVNTKTNGNKHKHTKSNNAQQQFQFFEVYKDEASIAFHREQAHFKAWGDFKVSGGVVADSQKVQKGVAFLWSG